MFSLIFRSVFPATSRKKNQLTSPLEFKSIFSVKLKTKIASNDSGAKQNYNQLAFTLGPQNHLVVYTDSSGSNDKTGAIAVIPSRRIICNAFLSSSQCFPVYSLILSYLKLIHKSVNLQFLSTNKALSAQQKNHLVNKDNIYYDLLLALSICYTKKESIQSFIRSQFMKK